MASNRDHTRNYSQFACIGSGFSAIGFGATLKRWYGIDDVRFFERDSGLGGNWFRNKYPGSACDVPSALYSYSFEPNPNWSQVLPSRDELYSYLKHVAAKYSLPPKMTFRAEVEKCEWIESRKRWRLHVRNLTTNQLFFHECQFLFVAVGQLVHPRAFDVPGAGNFNGPLFHSSQWPEELELENKRVVIFGNGCSAAQIVPSIVGKTKHLTQMIRAKYWLFPPIDGARTSLMRLIFRYIPGTMMLQRLIVYLACENSLRGFRMTKAGALFRQGRQAVSEKYMRAKAPAKYLDLLIPNYEIGCRRRIFDSGYLDSLHSPNLTLTDEPAVEIVPNGVKTRDGLIEADIIVLANGYVVNKFLFGIEVIGRDETATEHWSSFGGVEAYNCSVMSGFPNFFILLGPNSATGHTSALMAAENSINYALRIIEPVLKDPTGLVELKREAEEQEVSRMQRDLSTMVWSSGCHTWYVEKTKEGHTWNSMSYPYSQAYFWYRSLFPIWSHWQISSARSKSSLRLITELLRALLVLVGAFFIVTIYY